MKYIKWYGMLLAGIMLLYCNSVVVSASEGEVRITVSASDDGSGGLLYALDTDAPEAFGESNVFYVEPGTQHTVYVKDAAGNISSQLVEAPIADSDMDVTVGADMEDDNYIYESLYEENYDYDQDYEEEAAATAAEKGGGSVNEKTVTDGSDVAEKVFYTVTTKAGHTFYLFVDGSKDSDNVYLLDQVTDSDLSALALDTASQKREKDTASIADVTTAQADTVTTSSPKRDYSLIYILIFVGIFAAIYYYFKIYIPKRNKKYEDEDLDDAEDLDAFYNPDQDMDDSAEEDSEITFDENEEEEDEI